jgi:DNA-binding CsgD family transcriptional regulator
MIAFAIGCMCLALAVVYQIQKPHQWVKYFITCISSLLVCMMLSELQLMTNILLKDSFASLVVSKVISGILVGNVVFLVSFIPYFTTWVIRDSWHNPYKTFFLMLSCVYAVLGVLNIISPRSWCTNMMDILFVCVLAFCFCVMLKNLESIEEKGVRAVCITVIIVSVSMLPAIGATLVFPWLRNLMYGIYFLAFSITIMSYLFSYFTRNRVGTEDAPKKLTLQDLAPFHITEREYTVILLVSQGMTNKEIAAKLGISVNTVNNHVANIFAKTKVRSRIDLLNLLKQLW